MSRKFTCLLISIATLALPVSSSRAADLAEQARLLREGVQEALANLTKVCAEAWQYDNLRPTVARAVWPQGTMFKAPEVPVKQLSPASPLYRARWTNGVLGLAVRLANRALGGPPYRPERRSAAEA